MSERKKIESVINEISDRINNRTIYVQSCIELFNRTYDDALNLASKNKKVYIHMGVGDYVGKENEEQHKEIIMQRLRNKEYKISVEAPYNDGDYRRMWAQIYVDEVGLENEWTEITAKLYDLNNMIPDKNFEATFVWNSEKETWQKMEP